MAYSRGLMGAPAEAVGLGTQEPLEQIMNWPHMLSRSPTPSRDAFGGSLSSGASKPNTNSFARTRWPFGLPGEDAIYSAGHPGQRSSCHEK
eukprot:CAMPEP_0114239698 /NCGR_PEP_ID=MMETSP0058-20121206/8616_1 /TAXON_ID=36894 /ORGANISM="Pyramimonas parkeae, CCMP726" /LENGTH=90 /DNA_ID=CAMNT_0001351931 /DNA_START=644 /DNA_END=919 /DNA_ORIENTATION=-